MLSLTLTLALVSFAPPNGTYTYATAWNGSNAKTKITVTRDAGGDLVLSENGAGAMNGQSGNIVDTLMLAPTLVPISYSSLASIADSRNMRSFVTFKDQQAVQTGDVAKTYDLVADARHFVVLDFGPFSGFFALPAQVQAWGTSPLLAIVPTFAQGIPISVDPAMDPSRPKSVPAGDAQISVKSPMAFTVWYNPKTLVVDEMDVPSQNFTVTRLP
jgi:hypothetical protein